MRYYSRMGRKECILHGLIAFSLCFRSYRVFSDLHLLLASNTMVMSGGYISRDVQTN